MERIAGIVELIGISAFAWVTIVVWVLSFFHPSRSATEVETLRGVTNFATTQMVWVILAITILITIAWMPRLIATIGGAPALVAGVSERGWRLGLTGLGFLQGLLAYGQGAYGLIAGRMSPTKYLIREDARHVTTIALAEIVVCLVGAGICITEVR